MIDTILRVICLSSLIMVFYVYVGYPVIVFLLSLITRRAVDRGDYSPSVTIISAVYNEVAVIEASIKNKLALDYPSDKIEYIIVSDASDDGTDEVVRKLASCGVILIRQTLRMGKTAALNCAAGKATGEILVFADANSMFKEDTLRKLLQNFNDPEVGYVTGKMIYVNIKGAAIGDGCSAYMRYENILRTFETHLGSIVGVDGGVDAVRRELYVEMHSDQLPDFVLPLKVVAQGYRVVYEPLAVLKEQTLSETSDEYRMRIRVALRAFWALRDMHQLLFPGQFELFSWQLWSHKVLRYLCFVFLLSAFLTNLFLWNSSLFFSATLFGQAFVYMGAMLSPLFEKKGIKNSVLTWSHYFVMLNFASAVALIKYLRGEKVVIWQPRKG